MSQNKGNSSFCIIKIVVSVLAAITVSVISSSNAYSIDKTVHAIYEEGLQKYITGDLDAAVKDFERAFNLRKENTIYRKSFYKSLIKKGDDEYQSSNIRNAEQYYLKALRLYEKNRDLQYKLKTIADINDHLERQHENLGDKILSTIPQVLMTIAGFVLFFIIIALTRRIIKGKDRYPEKVSIEIPTIDEMDYANDDRYTQVMRANKLRELLREMESSDASWEGIQSYITELSYEVKSKILDIVETKLERRDETALNNSLEVVIPLLTENENEVINRTKAIALKATNEIADNPLNMNFLTQMASLIDSKTSRPDHSKRVADLAFHLAQKLDYPDLSPSLVKKAGLLHDIGFLQITGRVISEEKSIYINNNSSVSLNKILHNQFRIIRTHPDRGCNLMKYASVPETVLDGISYHHERLDGSGYPNGLMGNEIPVIARILAVAEFFDEGIYGNEWDRVKCINYLKAKSGLYFDEDVVNALLMIVDTLSEVFFNSESTYSEWIQ